MISLRPSRAYYTLADRYIVWHMNRSEATLMYSVNWKAMMLQTLLCQIYLFIWFSCDEWTYENRLFLENWMLIVYLYNIIKKFIKRGVDQSGFWEARIWDAIRALLSTLVVRRVMRTKLSIKLNFPRTDSTRNLNNCFFLFASIAFCILQTNM